MTIAKEKNKDERDIVLLFCTQLGNPICYRNKHQISTYLPVQPAKYCRLGTQ